MEELENIDLAVVAGVFSMDSEMFESFFLGEIRPARFGFGKYVCH